MDRVDATEEALKAIGSLTAKYGKLMFVESGGCCDGSSPICFREGEFLLGPHDVLLGEVGGARFYIDIDQYDRWRRPSFTLDVAPGAAEGFSLEGLEGFRFVARSGKVAARRRVGYELVGPMVEELRDLPPRHER